MSDRENNVRPLCGETRLRCPLYKARGWLHFAWACLLAAAVASPAAAQGELFTVARVRYAGGGDWYNDPSAIPNLLSFMAEHTNVRVASDQVVVGIMDEKLFSYPVLYLTGHGRISFSPQEVERLRHYLTHGGFLYADDDYGMDSFFRAEMAKVFPGKRFVELPFSHEIYHIHFDFPQGLPKTHEHDGKPPQGFGLFCEGRLVVFYTYETNISDGWVDPEVHGDPPEKRLEALQMGTNIMIYALTH
ncbi:MAG: DUF4159 domain-containing protein [bacterium]|jgi:hypothetical protein|nr:DUF4159 domain-containing protein [candidate division KSB1 bacterium]MDH7561186.1 DUF4159 domain-containing protein [bacterium]